MLNIKNRLMVRLSIPALWLGSLLISRSAVAEDAGRSSVNMPIGVTPISADIYGLHMDIFWWCVGIGVVKS